MRRTLISGLLVVAFLAFPQAMAAATAAAGCGASFGATGTLLNMKVNNRTQGCTKKELVDAGYSPVPICDGIAQAHTCRNQDTCGSDGLRFKLYFHGVDTGDTFCAEDREAPITPGMVASVAKRLHWRPNRIVIQPPGGISLVNMDTYFYTEDNGTQSQTVRAFGRQITIEATPFQYEWYFGDGSSAITSTPGRPYPAGDVFHVYLRKGEVSPRVDTLYQGRFRIGNGPWTEIPTRLSVQGPSASLDIRTAAPTLVS